MNLTKKLAVAGMAAILTAGISMTSFAGEWKLDQVGWWYQNDDGSYAKDGWAKIDNVWYWFDETGYMETGWIYDAGNYYYLIESGGMAAGTDVVVDGYLYRFASDGALMDDWVLGNSISDYSICIPDGSYFYDESFLSMTGNAHDFYAQLDGAGELVPWVRVAYDSGEDAQLSMSGYVNACKEAYETKGYGFKDNGSVTLGDGRVYTKVSLITGSLTEDLYLRKISYNGSPLYMYFGLGYSNADEKKRVEAVLKSVSVY